MGGVVHGDHFFPVVWPAVHVLGVGSGEVLDFPEFAFFVEILEEEEFAGVDDGFGHHVFEAGFGDEFADLIAFLDGGGHGDGTHDVLAGLQGLHGHPGVVGDGTVDVDEVDVGVAEDVFVGGIAFGDAELVSRLVEFGFVATAESGDIGERVGLVDGDELRTEAESHHRHIDRFVRHRRSPAVEVERVWLRQRKFPTGTGCHAVG